MRGGGIRGILKSMKRALLTLLLAVPGCFSTSEDARDCYGLTRTDVPCQYQGTFAPGYECANLTEIQYDSAALSRDEVTVVCGATDTDSLITIHKPGEDCGSHWVEGCR